MPRSDLIEVYKIMSGIEGKSLILWWLQNQKQKKHRFKVRGIRRSAVSIYLFFAWRVIKYLEHIARGGDGIRYNHCI